MTRSVMSLVSPTMLSIGGLSRRQAAPLIGG
jgi:hypothetical protein